MHLFTDKFIDALQVLLVNGSDNGRRWRKFGWLRYRQEELFGGLDVGTVLRPVLEHELDALCRGVPGEHATARLYILT